MSESKWSIVAQRLSAGRIALRWRDESSPFIVLGEGEAFQTGWLGENRFQFINLNKTIKVYKEQRYKCETYEIQPEPVALVDEQTERPENLVETIILGWVENWHLNIPYPELNDLVARLATVISDASETEAEAE